MGLSSRSDLSAVTCVSCKGQCSVTPQEDAACGKGIPRRLDLTVGAAFFIFASDKVDSVLVGIVYDFNKYRPLHVGCHTVDFIDKKQAKFPCVRNIHASHEPSGLCN